MTDLTKATEDKSRASERALTQFEAQFVTEEELANLLKVSTRTLQRMRHRGLLASHLYVGGRVRYLLDKTLQEIAALGRQRNGGRGSLTGIA